METKKHKIVYRMDIAIELQKLGYNVIATLPNPQNAKFKCFVFEVSDHFYQDLDRLREEVRYGKN